MKVIIETHKDKKEFSPVWIHGTYNATMFMSMDEDGAEIFDIYYPPDRKPLGLSSPLEIDVYGKDLQIHFFHGRQSKDEVLSDWGSNGPKVKVLSVLLDRLGMSIRTTVDGALVRVNYDDDLLLWEGIYYGDFCIDHVMAEA